MVVCVVCGAELAGRQSKFCSRACKNAFGNNRYQAYRAQQRRGRRRKLRLLRDKGSRCERCGYRKNHAALEFHHEKPDEKRFTLDLRSLSNRSWRAVVEESRRCVLLCSNCHAELHNPGCDIGE